MGFVRQCSMTSQFLMPRVRNWRHDTMSLRALSRALSRAPDYARQQCQQPSGPALGRPAYALAVVAVSHEDAAVRGAHQNAAALAVVNLDLAAAIEQVDVAVAAVSDGEALALDRPASASAQQLWTPPSNPCPLPLLPGQLADGGVREVREMVVECKAVVVDRAHRHLRELHRGALQHAALPHAARRVGCRRD